MGDSLRDQGISHMRGMMSETGPIVVADACYRLGGETASEVVRVPVHACVYVYVSVCGVCCFA